MPKDATKNVERYKVRGGHLNEYEYQQDKAADKKETATNKQQLDNEQAAMPKEKVDKSTPSEKPRH
jgi:hypothetical protein